MGLKRFNTNLESKKLANKQKREYNVKTRTLILSIGILVCSIILCTYATFSSNNKVDVINSSVGNLEQIDYKVNIYIDGTLTNNVPDKNAGYEVDSITCTHNALGKWDNSHWGITITNTQEPTECNVYFVESTGISLPTLLNSGAGKANLIPVKYGTDGATIVADPNNEDNDWFDYDSHKWANAVLVSNYSNYFDSNGNLIDSKIGETITSSNILQYYVWIPRYKYKLFNTESNSVLNEKIIEIEFESKNKAKSNGDSNGEWLTHPAFTFGDTELSGFWVGKFEPSYEGNGTGQASGTGYVSSVNGLFTCSNDTCSDASKLRVLPNANPIRNENMANIFYITKSIENDSTFNLESNKIDAHLMKNLEWGAVAYLTNSIYGRYISSNTCSSGGCEVWINPYNSSDTYKTGCAGGSVSASEGTTCNQWYTTNGVHASTTDNVYGIYDMSGGCYEYTMGNMDFDDNPIYPRNSGFGLDLDPKYFDVYESVTSETNYTAGLLGDATRETIKTNNSATGGWYDDRSQFIYFRLSGLVSVYPWFMRGGSASEGVNAGIFAFNYESGRNNKAYSSRMVLCDE